MILKPGISAKNIKTYFFFMMFGIAIFVFMNTAQPFVLNSILFVEKDEQGGVTGDLAFYGEITQIVTIGLWGALSDKIGRKMVTTMALIIMSFAFGGYPFATSVWLLTLYRIIYHVGCAGAQSFMTAGLADYPADETKGKASGFMGVFSGLGALLALFVIVRIAEFTEMAGAGPVSSGRSMYFFVVFMCVATAFMCLWGLKDPPQDPESIAARKKSILVVLKEGVQAGIDDPVLMLAYFGAFVSRGDSAILNIFLSLWVNQWATDNDYTGTEAIALAGTMVGISQGAAMMTAPIWGWMSDKYPKIVSLNWSCFVAAVGYLMLGFRENPTDGLAYVATVVIGAGQMGGIICGQALVAYHSPDVIAGSVSGVYGFTGACGILMVTKLGGYLFEEWREGAPLIILAGMNIAQLIYGIIVHYKYPGALPLQLQMDRPNNIYRKDYASIHNPLLSKV